MKNYICIDGVKTKISCETAENLKRDFAFEKPKELRHGDYGYDKNYPESLRIFCGSEKINSFNAGGSACGIDVNDGGYEGYYVILGNIFDDLERNSKDLEMFYGCYDDGERKMKVSIEGKYIEFKVGGYHFTSSLSETIKIHQKLGQVIATALRHKHKDC